MLLLIGYLASFHWNDSRYLSSGPVACGAQSMSGARVGRRLGAGQGRRAVAGREAGPRSTAPFRMHVLPLAVRLLSSFSMLRSRSDASALTTLVTVASLTMSALARSSDSCIRASRVPTWGGANQTRARAPASARGLLLASKHASEQQDGALQHLQLGGQVKLEGRRDIAEPGPQDFVRLNARAPRPDPAHRCLAVERACARVARGAGQM